MAVTHSPHDVYGPLAEASVAGSPVLRQNENNSVEPFQRLSLKDALELTVSPCMHDQNVGRESKSEESQNVAVTLNDLQEKVRSRRRMSINSSASRLSKYSFSSIRNRLKRSRSHETQKVVNDATDGSGLQGNSGATVLKRSSTSRLRGGLGNRTVMEETLQASETEKMAELLQAKEIAQQERRRVAEIEKELKATTQAFRDLCIKLQRKEEELEIHKANAEQAKKNEKLLQKDIKEERAAAEKVYKMYVDLAYEVESTKLDISIPNIA